MLLDRDAALDVLHEKGRVRYVHEHQHWGVQPCFAAPRQAPSFSHAPRGPKLVVEGGVPVSLPEAFLGDGGSAAQGESEDARFCTL